MVQRAKKYGKKTQNDLVAAFAQMTTSSPKKGMSLDSDWSRVSPE